MKNFDLAFEEYIKAIKIHSKNFGYENFKMKLEEINSEILINKNKDDNYNNLIKNNILYNFEKCNYKLFNNKKLYIKKGNKNKIIILFRFRQFKIFKFKNTYKS
jgi:hypothetical protein